MLRETDIKASAGQKIFDRGVSYFRAGAVTELVQRGQNITAEVEGSDDDPYEVIIWLDEAGDVVSSTCSCPYGAVCKHVVAVLLTVVHTPEKISQREPVAQLLAQLPDEHLRAVLQMILQEYPVTVAILEQEVALQTSSNRMVMASTAPIEDIARAIRQEFRQIVRDYDNDDYWEDEGLDLVSIIQPYLEQLPTWLARGAEDTAVVILATVTQEMLEGWNRLDEDLQEANEFALEDALLVLDEAWAELFLRQPATAKIPDQWVKMLTDCEKKVPTDLEFALSRTAIAQGWTYPPLVRVLNGHITALGAWEGESPPFADKLALIRLRILSEQKRYQEYLYLAEAEGQSALFLQMLVQQGGVARAVQEAQTLYRGDLADLLKFGQMLQKEGHTAVGVQIAEWGLDLPQPTPAPTQSNPQYSADQWRRDKHDLAAWLYTQAEELGQVALAVKAAETAFLHQGRLADYQAVQRLSGTSWPQKQQQLRPYIEQSYDAVRLYLLEGMLPEAMSAYTQGVGRGDVRLAEMVTAMQGVYPDWAIAQCVKVAEPIMDGGKAQAYGEAARWLQLAHDVYLHHGRGDEWQAYKAELLIKHSRKRNLVPLLKQIR
jgi:uncharacterized Zn finger protein